MISIKTELPAVTDEELLAAHLAGDHDAFAGLVRRHERALYRFLRRFVGDAAAADDVFQESLLQVHQSAHRFDLDKSFRPWLFTIAANKARDLLRARGRRRTVSTDLPTGDGTSTLIDAIASDATGPDALAETAEVRRRVIAVVDALPPGHREVLRLAYFHQLPYRRISDELGVPLGTVKSRLHVAVKAFAGLWGRGRIEGDPRRN